jgi:hypothetical protein
MPVGARWRFVESPSRFIFLFEHDPRANAWRSRVGKPVTSSLATIRSRYAILERPLDADKAEDIIAAVRIEVVP